MGITTQGFYNPEEHAEMLKEVLELPYWKPGLPVLLDNRKLSYVEATDQDLQQSSNEMEKSNRLIGDSKIAFLAGSLANLEVIRRFELICEEDIEAWMQVFLDEGQALRWIQKYRTDYNFSEKRDDDDDHVL